MPRRVVDLREQRPILDIASYGRGAPGHRPLTMAEIEVVSRTVRRVPEVMIKVSGGAHTLRGVCAHLAYVGREGEGVVETDDGQRLQQKGFEKTLVEDWDLDLELPGRHTQHAVAARARPAKLVHNLVFSMPKGTPAERVHAAVRKFATEEFALQHRYAMALHTDQGHPHVHLVVKAVSEEGARLNIRKATLREWRREFARHLRAEGISANATDKAVRGTTRPKLSDGMYRALQRGASRRILEQRGAAGMERTIASEASSRESLMHNRAQVERGWMAAAEILDRQGQQDLAWQVRRFTEALPPIRTDRELLRETMKPRERRPPWQELTR